MLQPCPASSSVNGRGGGRGRERRFRDATITRHSRVKSEIPTYTTRQCYAVRRNIFGGILMAIRTLGCHPGTRTTGRDYDHFTMLVGKFWPSPPSPL